MRTNLWSRLRFSESSFNFLQNCIIFCVLYPCRYMTGRLHPLKPPASLPEACRAERVNDQSEKILNLLFFLFLLEMSSAITIPSSAEVAHRAERVKNPGIVRKVFSDISRHIQGHSTIFSHVQAYSGRLRHTQVYSGIIKAY